MTVALATRRRINEVRPADRQLFPRRHVCLRAEARRLDHSLPALRNPRLDLKVQELSSIGLTAYCDTPMECGEHVGIRFPSQGQQRPWDAFGRVVRCDPGMLGYRVAVEFDCLPAA